MKLPFTSLVYQLIYIYIYYTHILSYIPLEFFLVGYFPMIVDDWWFVSQNGGLVCVFPNQLRIKERRQKGLSMWT